MAHLRQAIRDRVVTTLTGLTTTGAKVYRSRVYPITATELPALVVSTESETVEHITMSPPRTQQRTVSINIGIYVRAVSDYDTTIDTIAAEVEAALYADASINNLAKDAKITGIDIQFSGEGDQPVAIGVLRFEVDYMAIEGSPTI